MGEAPPEADVAVGDEVELDIGPVAHGGICVARIGGAGGRVVFVRYALPGERAVVRITEARPGSFCRGEAVTILRADPRRVPTPCVHFGPGGCGGCDFQHAAPDLQRELKAAVVAEQMLRLAGLVVAVTVESLPGDGFGWRMRVRWGVGDRGRPPGSGGVAAAGSSPDRGTAPAVVLGPRRYRSHDVVPVTLDAPCLIAAPDLTEAAQRLRPPAGADEVVLAHTQGGPPVVTWWRGEGRGASPARGSPRRADRFARPGSTVGADHGDSSGGARTLTEHAAGRAWTVAPAGFWQAHAHAADTLCAAVRDATRGIDLAGGSAWDLYGGVGLFAAVLADLVGPSGSVTTVEGDGAASALAAANLTDLRQVRVVAGRVEQVLPRLGGPVDAVVLDPPRTGAGQKVCSAIAGRGPAVVVYVACDPAALARDTGALAAAGYRLDTLRAFDAFPQTHHVECVARFVAAGRSSDA